MENYFQRKVLWFLLLGATCFITFFLFIKTIKNINNYFNLDTSSACKFEKFQILEDRKGICQIKTYYNFKVNNNFYEKEEILKNYFFLNSFAAQDKINEIIKNNKIYYKKNNPKISSISKEFPVKNLIYFLTSFSLSIYFIFLKIYVLRRQKNN
jgi:hypothetical protein